MYLFWLMALLGGAGLSIQASINTGLSSHLGGQPLIGALISFFVGTLCLDVVAGMQADWPSVTQNVSTLPWWRWIGGMIGAGFVFTSIFLAPKLGVTNTMFLFILGQLVSGMVIDHFGLIDMPIRPVHWWKILGVGVMLMGLALFMFGEKLFSSQSTLS